MDSVKFNIGEIVYFRLGGDAGIITGILFRPTAVIYYVSTENGGERMCYDIELCGERTFTNPETESTKEK
jgi:hypothetical protein